MHTAQIRANFAQNQPSKRLLAKTREKSHLMTLERTLSVKALRLCQIPPFVTYGDIFPRCGGSLPSQGELLSISYGQR